MCVLRLFVFNRPDRDFSLTFHCFKTFCKSGCPPFTFSLVSTFSSCSNRNYIDQTLKNYKQCNIKNFSTNFKYLQTKQAINKSNIDSDTAPKLIYNSVIKFRGFIAEKRRQDYIRKHKLKNEDQRDLKCVALKYFKDKIIEESNISRSFENDKEESTLNIPYSIHKSVLINEETNEFVDIKGNTDYNIAETNYSEDNLYSSPVHKKMSDGSVETLINDNTSTSHENWMFDYENYKGTEDFSDKNENNELQDWKLNYGTSNPNVPVSKVPCGGCGALLHCQDPAIPGYLPTELFEDMKVSQLRGITCQRCHFLKEYNTALAVNVDPKEYPKILSKIKDENALVILMVDMTDFPCSIWPGILNIIGPKRKLFVVGNKVDLLQGHTKNWLDHAKKSLEAALPVNANIKHLSLISAKTGFGVEELINKLFNVWEYRGDVYLVGCTNVGKSTLFNTLLQSDYCKVKAVDLLQRATTSPWPGTTLNLLKFPIQRPEGWKLFYRTKRLQHEKNIMNEERKLLQQQNKKRNSSGKVPLQLIGHVGRTFKNQMKKEDIQLDPFSLSGIKNLQNSMASSGLDPTDKDFIDGRWLYDTPGTVQPDQIIDLLTIDELMKTLPKNVIIPRTFRLQPNQSLFIGGLGRLDYLEGNINLKFTVCAAISLPVTVCHTDDAKEVYDYYIGTNVLQVPFGDESRMKAWPGLQSGQKFVLRGISSNESCADVVLSSAGWIAVTPGPQEICKFLAWTPQARGIHVRIPPVLPYVVNLRGKQISQTVAYKVAK